MATPADRSPLANPPLSIGGGVPAIARGDGGAIQAVAKLLDPVLVVVTLWACTRLHGRPFGAPEMIVSVLAFSLMFPSPVDYFRQKRAVVRDVVLGWALAVFILLFFGYASKSLERFDLRVIVSWLLATPTLLVLAHLAVPRIVRSIAAADARRAVVIGANALGATLARKMRDEPHLGLEFAGYFDDRAPQRIGPELSPKVLGRLADVRAEIARRNVGVIYVALPMASHPRILGLLEDLRDTTASIYFVPDIFVFDHIQARVDDVGGIPVVAVCETPFQGFAGFSKRLMDVAVSLGALVALSPLLLAIALAVKATSPGPVLFRQRRYGLDGQEIVVYKFRTMTVMEDGAVVRQATRNDQRLTRIGGFLRRTSLDELPQFLNVLQGRMSVVGPRPHAVAHNETYRRIIRGYMIRHKVKPGITGWAQVNGARGETDTLEKMERRVELDLEYLRRWSLRLDLLIVLRTFLMVFRRDGNAY